MGNMTALSMATYLPQQWSTLATITYRQTQIIWPLMDHRWEPELGVGRGDTVLIPNFTQNTRSDVTKRTTFGTAASISFVGNTELQTSLVVDTMAYQAHRMVVEMSVQSMPMYNTLLVEGIGQALAQQMDYDIASGDSNGFDSFTAIGTNNVDVTEGTILQGETNLNDNLAPASGRYFVMSPATRASILQIEVLRNQLFSSVMGSLQGDVANGFMGKILTLNCYMDADLEVGSGSTGRKNFIGHTEAIAVAAQQNVKMVGGLNIADGLINEVAGYVVYGFKKVKSAFGREVDGK